MSTGGARFGAGRPSKGYLSGENLQRIDIRQWTKGNYLKTGYYFNWVWSSNGNPSGNITVLSLGNSIELRYIVGSEEKKRQGNQVIQILQTNCNFGASRPWFQCPVCADRVGLLYFRSGRFACRHCQRVVYASQREDVMARTWRAQRKIEAHMDGKMGDWFFQRPKGMHWTTFEALSEKRRRYESQRERLLAPMMMRLNAQIDRIRRSNQKRA